MSLQNYTKNIKPIQESTNGIMKHITQDPKSFKATGVTESMSVFEQAELYLQEGFFGFGKKKEPVKKKY